MHPSPPIYLVLLLQTDKMKETMIKVLQDGRDEDLIGDVESFKGRIAGLMSFMRPVVKRGITGDDILFAMITKAEAASTTGLMSVLKRRRHHHRKSDNVAEAKRAFDFSVMYSQLVTLQELALTQVILLLKKDKEELYILGKQQVFRSSD